MLFQTGNSWHSWGNWWLHSCLHRWPRGELKSLKFDWEWIHVHSFVSPMPFVSLESSERHFVDLVQVVVMVRQMKMTTFQSEYPVLARAIAKVASWPRSVSTFCRLLRAGCTVVLPSEWTLLTGHRGAICTSPMTWRSSNPTRSSWIKFTTRPLLFCKFTKRPFWGFWLGKRRCNKSWPLGAA